MAVGCLKLIKVLSVAGLDPSGTTVPSGKYHSAVDDASVKHARAAPELPPAPTALISNIELAG